MTIVITDNLGTTTSDGAFPSDATKLKTITKRKQTDKEKTMSEISTEEYKIYEEGYYTIFEFLNEQHWNMFFQAYKNEDHRQLRMVEATSKCLEAYGRSNRNVFHVRHGDQTLRMHRAF